MNIEMPKSYEDTLKEEIARIIRTYPERLNKALSILDETQKIIEEEGISDPRLKKDLPLEVTGMIRQLGKYKALRKKKPDLMAKYAEESSRDSYFIKKREQEE